jgi:hypothetical protein
MHTAAGRFDLIIGNATIIMEDDCDETAQPGINLSVRFWPDRKAHRNTTLIRASDPTNFNTRIYSGDRITGSNPGAFQDDAELCMEVKKNSVDMERPSNTQVSQEKNSSQNSDNTVNDRPKIRDEWALDHLANSRYKLDRNAQEIQDDLEDDGSRDIPNTRQTIGPDRNSPAANENCLLGRF